MLALADRLHLPLAAVEGMAVDEFMEWLAFFRIMKEESDGRRSRPR